MVKPLTKQEQFFYDHAGYSYDPRTETPEEGRQRCARKLAAAETWAVQNGYRFSTIPDPDADDSWMDEETPEYQEKWRGKAKQVVMYNFDGDVVQVLGGVYGEEPYLRIVRVDLALAEML